MEQQIAMYGCDIEAFEESVMNSATYKFTGANMVVAGLMSDAQEVMAFGDVESARKYLNKAKYLLFKIMDGELVGTVEQ